MDTLKHSSQRMLAGSEYREELLMFGENTGTRLIGTTEAIFSSVDAD